MDYCLGCIHDLIHSPLLFLNQEVTVGPGNRTAASNDNFLRVNLVGDYVGYTDIPSFEDYYLVIPRQVLLLINLT